MSKWYFNIEIMGRGETPRQAWKDAWENIDPSELSFDQYMAEGGDLTEEKDEDED